MKRIASFPPVITLKSRLILSLVGLMAIALSGFGQETTTGIERSWISIVPGIQYREFILPGPEHVYAARMDRSDPHVTLDTSIAQGRLSGGLETVRAMAERYDQALGYWGEDWGVRNQVAVAVNGYFYDTETGVPESGQVQSSWYVKRFNERQNGSGFAWTLERNAFIGGCIVHNRNKQILTIKRTGEVLPFDNINIPREPGELILYTPQYDASTLTDDNGVEVLVELNKPMQLLPEPAMITGVVRAVRDGQGSTPLPFESVVISGSGSAADLLRQSFQVGDEVGISQEIHHFQPDCRVPNPMSWSKTYAAIGVSYVFLKDGVIQKLGETGQVLRSPRTAVAFNDQYIFFFVVDGRDRLNSLGMSMVELGVFAKTYLGAVWGAALDGGGSSTMIVNGQLMNSPNTEVQDPNVQSEHIERAVANGLMMVVVLPKEQSIKFKPGDKVSVSGTGSVNLRLGPGTNYAVIGGLTPGSLGVIQDQPNGLNGVLAKGSYWWEAAFGDVVGWISEDFLDLQN